METQHLFSAASLRIIEESSHGILILVEGLEREEFLRSRITRTEACRLLSTIATTLQQLPERAHSAMPELGWDGWRATAYQLGAKPGPDQDEAIWFAVLSLVPATLMWLRVYRQNQPELFSFSVS